MSTVLEYPEDLNPFADEFDEKSDEKSDKRSDKRSEKYPETFNPFDDDDDANELDANKNEIIKKNDEITSTSTRSKFDYTSPNFRVCA